MGFINSAQIDYPVEEVFKIFIRVAKRDFPKFNEKNPVGCSVTKKSGSYSAKSVELRVEITDYKLNELYQITSTKEKLAYVSTYKFEKVDDERCILTLEEYENTPGYFASFNAIIQNFCFKGRVKRRFTYFVEGLEKEVAEYQKRVANSQGKSEEEKAKQQEAREAALARKEAAKKAKEAAEEAKAAARKALEEAKALEKLAEEAAVEASDNEEK